MSRDELLKIYHHSKSYLLNGESSGGSKESTRDICPPKGPNSFNFMQFLGKFGKLYVGAPLGVGTPPQGDSGSTIGKTAKAETPYIMIQKIER